MALATRPFRNLAPTDTIPGFCVPEMFSRRLLSAGPLAPLYPAPWEGWMVNADPAFDGHDLGALVDALDAFPFEPGKPSMIVADTVKGKGVSFMENSLLWHYRCPDPKEFEAAMRELGDA